MLTKFFNDASKLHVSEERGYHWSCKKIGMQAKILFQTIQINEIDCSYLNYEMHTGRRKLFSRNTDSSPRDFVSTFLRL